MELKPKFMKWKKFNMEEKMDWCLKWFKVLLILMCVRASIEAMQYLLVFKAYGYI